MDRSGIFAGNDPFAIAQRWLTEAEASEPNDPNAIALATVDADGLPNVRMVLLKEIESGGDGGGGFVFFPHYGSKKGEGNAPPSKTALLLHRENPRGRTAGGCLFRQPQPEVATGGLGVETVRTPALA